MGEKGEMTQGAEAAASVCGRGTEAIWAERVAEAARRRPGLPRFAPRRGQLEWIVAPLLQWEDILLSHKIF